MVYVSTATAATANTSASSDNTSSEANVQTAPTVVLAVSGAVIPDAASGEGECSVCL